MGRRLRSMRWADVYVPHVSPASMSPASMRRCPRSAPAPSAPALDAMGRRLRLHAGRRCCPPESLHGDDAGCRGYHRRRRAGTLPRAARGFSGGQLPLGAVPPVAAGRALRVAPGVGCPQLHADTDGVLQAPVFRLRRLRRGAREVHGGLARRGEHRLLHGLSACRREISRGLRAVLEAPVAGLGQAQDHVEQLRHAVWISVRFGGKRRPRHLTLRAQQSDSAARTAVAHAAKRYWRYSDEYLTASTVEAACQWVNPIFCRMPWGGRDSENGVLENGVY